MFPEDPIESARTRISETGVSGTGISEASPRPEFRVSRFATPEPEVYSAPTLRLWLHLLLLVLTLFTTTLVGAHIQYNFSHNLPFFVDVQDEFPGTYTAGMQSLSRFLAGLPFSLTLLTILMAHELGHYLACVYYGIDASLPFFLPVPAPISGTWGAFIRIRSPIRSKRILFDIGVAGPIAGFVFLIPALGAGLAFSKVLPGINHAGIIRFGAPALQRLAQWLIFPGVPPQDIYLHPVARAAEVGMFATALNLLPAGQLDGGHVVYALLGKSQKWITYALLAVLAGIGFLWIEWWVFAAIIFVFARKHPPLYDQSEIGESRVKLGILALVIFALCFSIAPFNQ